MNLRSRLRRIRDLPGAVADTTGDLADQVLKARDYLGERVPVLTDAVSAASRFERGVKGEYVARYGLDPMRIFERATGDVRDVGAVTKEPAFLGLNRALGITSPDNPLGGGQEAAAQRAAKGVEGPLGPAARAGVSAFGLATDFTNLAGSSTGSFARIAAKEAGIGAVQGAAQSLGSEGGTALAPRLGLSPATGELVGGLLAAPLAVGSGTAFASRIKALRTAAETGATRIPRGVMAAVEDASMSSPVPPGHVRLYRGQPGKVTPLPDWVREMKEADGSLAAQGRWFTDDLENAQWYRNDVNPAFDPHIAYVDVPKSIYDQFRVTNVPDALGFSREKHREWFLPPEWAEKAQRLEGDSTILLHSGIPFSLPIASAVVGGAAGAASTPEDASMQERALRVLGGAAAGYGAGRFGRPVVRGANQVVRSAVAPALTRDPAFNARLDSFVKTSSSGADSYAFAIRKAVQPAEQTLMDEVAKGAVRETPAGQARTAANIAAAVSPQAAEAARASALTARTILQHPDEFTYSPKAKAALERIQGVTGDILKKDQANNVAPETLRENYLTQIWDREPPRAVVKGGVTGRQSYFNQAVIADYQAGEAAGMVPKATAVADIIAARAKAGYVAAAQKSLLDEIKANPEWFKSSVAWDATTKQWVKNPTIPDDWVRDDLLVDRIYPTLSAEARDQILTDLAGGAKTVPEAAKALKAELGAGRSSFYINPDVADALHAQLNPRTFGNAPWATALEAVTSEARGFRLGFDVAMSGRQIPQMMVQAIAADPVHAWRGADAVTRGWVRTLVPGAMDKFRASPKYQRWANHMTISPDVEDLGEALSRPAGGTFLERNLTTGASLFGQFVDASPNAWKARLVGGVAGGAAGAAFGPGDTPEERLRNAAIGAGVGAGLGPGAVNALYGLEKWQFGKLIPSLKVETADVAFNNYRRMEQYKHLSDEALMELVGRRMETLSTGISRVRAGISQNQAWGERQFVLSPALARGAIANVADVFKPGVEGSLARRFWATLIPTAIATSVAGSLVFTNDYSPEHLLNLLDPRRKSAVTNPTGNNFLGMELPGGNTVQWWGPVTAPMKMILGPLHKAATAGSESSGDGLIWAGINSALAGVTGLKDSSLRFAEGRRSVPVGMLQDWYRNRDFRGRAIATSSDPTERLKQMAVYQLQQLTPSISGLAVSTDRVNQPEWQGSRGAERLGAVLQAAGLNFNPAPQTPSAVAETLDAFLHAQGVDPGRDPVGAYKQALRDGTIGTNANDEFRRQHPDIGDFLKTARAQRATDVGRPVGREAAANYSADIDRINTDKQQAIAQNDAAYQANRISGEAWKEKNSEILKSAVVAKQAVGTVWFGESNPQKLREAINRAYGSDSSRKTDHVGDLLDEYYAMRPQAETPEGIQQFYDDRKAWLDNLRATDPQGYAEFKRNQDLRLSPVQRQYAQAADLMGQYMEIPQFRGMTAEEGRRVNDILKRASALKRAGAVRTERQGIMRDRDTEYVMRARRAQGGRLSSRERSRFWMSHPELSQFFSGLLKEDIDRIVGVA